MSIELLELWKLHSLALLCGCVLDWMLGDPYWMPHPVRLMGAMIASLEKMLRVIFLEGRVKEKDRNKGWKREQAGGICLVLIMIFVWTAGPLALLLAAAAFAGEKALFLIETVISYQLLAARSLCRESMKVSKSLKKGDTEQARREVSMIVGRDTAVLDGAGIARAAVETVAENTSDGVIAPFLWMAVFGPAGGTFYKAVNTMDSMVGYTSERYLHFGRAAAKLDDALNFLPARITGVLMVASAWILPGADGRKAWNIFFRDRKNHASPNSAHGEAACAGALHLQLAGDAWYFGVLHKKPFIGDDLREIQPEDIGRANGLMLVSEGILMALLAAVLILLSKQ